MDADELVDFGAVVVVVVVVVAGVVVAVVASDDEVPADEEELAAVDVDEGSVDVEAAAVVGVVVAWVATVEEWAVAPDATRTPRPTAPADAARPMPTVARRTRVMARSRARAAEWGEGWCGRRCGGMPGLSVPGQSSP